MIKKRKEKKTINEYAELASKIRNEYAQLQRENNELKIELQKYQNHVQKNTQWNPSYQRYRANTIRKRKHYHYHKSEQSEESDSYVTEIRRRPKKQRKRIVYGDKTDGLPEYEPDSLTEEEQEEDNSYEIQTRPKGKQQKKIEKPKKVKKGITKSIKI